jgi:predicted ATPase
MIQIDSIEISYFRSIHKVKLRNLTDLVVLSGRNDIGKSNLVKALNLFFNNQTDWNTPFDFTRDFSRRRLREVRKETIKGKQYVQVKLGFVRGERYEKSLPKRFVVTRTWYRDSLVPDTRSSLQRQFTIGEVPTQSLDRAQASLQRYLNTIRFEYVPAIKDQQFFTYMLGLLQDRIFGFREGESEVGDAVRQLNATVTREGESLRAEFGQVTGVVADIRLPEQLSGLFRAFAVATMSGEEEMPLNVRGDGIRSRFLPSLLHYVSARSQLVYIWGFEEPENSLEYRLATELAKNMAEDYSQQAQIVVTSHSPAFFGLATPNTTVCRVYSEDDSTAVQTLRVGTTTSIASDDVQALETDLGLMQFQEECQKEYERRLAIVEGMRVEVEKTKKEMRREQSPVLLTEGKWDAVILTEAWRRLHSPKEPPFRILSCDPLPSEPAQGAGGVGTLRGCLETVRPDEPVAVGLFDADNEGYRSGFGQLNANFILQADRELKLQKCGTAAALILPVIAGREKYAESQTFVLEFYFDDQYLGTKVKGRGLVLVLGEIERTVIGTGQKLGKMQTPEPHLRRIHPDSKKVFAEEVVPSLPDEAFGHFAALFSKVTKAIAELKKLRASV